MAATGQRLTQKTVEEAVCPPGKKDCLIFDSETRGFGLRVTVGGGKTFLAQYQAAGAKRRVTLGAFGVLTVDQARKAAKGILGKAALGGDPVAEKQAQDAAAARTKVEAAFTVRALIERWVKAREGDRRASYLLIAKAHLIRNLPEWLDRPAASITMGEAVALLDRLKHEKGVVTANRTLAYASAAYGWAVKRQALALNPLRGIERPGREMARERVLDGAELRAIWQACGKVKNPALGGAVRLLMLTLGRRDEVASMRWDELDDAKRPTTWTVPRERAKNGKAHVVHLSAPARAVIVGMPRLIGHLHVFAGQEARDARDGKPERPARPVAAFSLAKDQIEGAILEADPEAKLAGWTFHDFRRSGVTALADMGFAPHVCDRLLNHVTGSIQGVAAVYQRAEFLKERREALDAWALFVAGEASQ